MAYGQRGLTASRSLSGGDPVLITLPVFIDAKMAYFIGDPVELRAGGWAALVTAAVETAPLGVVQSVYGIDADGNPKPLTFNQPNNGVYLSTGVTGFVKVNVTPSQLYVCQIDVSASAGLVGKTVHVSAGAPNTRAGISGYNLAGATIGVSSNKPFQIVGIAPNELIAGRGDKAAGSAVEVRCNGTIFSHAQRAGI